MAQATLRLRLELECEWVIRLAHGRGVASATAYRGPEGDSPIFVMLLDEAEELERFLPELLKASPEVPVSVIREEVEHVSPDDFLRAACCTQDRSGPRPGTSAGSSPAVL